MWVMDVGNLKKWLMVGWIAMKIRKNLVPDPNKCDCHMLSVGYDVIIDISN